jgi:hypothetical protein
LLPCSPPYMRNAPQTRAAAQDALLHEKRMCDCGKLIDTALSRLPHGCSSPSQSAQFPQIFGGWFRCGWRHVAGRRPSDPGACAKPQDSQAQGGAKRLSVLCGGLRQCRRWTAAYGNPLFGKWVGLDVPDFPLTKKPNAPAQPHGVGLDFHDGASPFIMKTMAKPGCLRLLGAWTGRCLHTTSPMSHRCKTSSISSKRTP